MNLIEENRDFFTKIVHLIIRGTKNGISWLSRTQYYLDGISFLEALSNLTHKSSFGNKFGGKGSYQIKKENIKRSTSIDILQLDEMFVNFGCGLKSTEN